MQDRFLLTEAAVMATVEKLRPKSALPACFPIERLHPVEGLLGGIGREQAVAASVQEKERLGTQPAGNIGKVVALA